MNPGPIAVEALRDFELLITFENGERKVFDVKPLLHFPIYKRINNKGFFSLAKADGMCVYWSDDIDLCPDMVYEKGIPYDDYTEENLL